MKFRRIRPLHVMPTSCGLFACAILIGTVAIGASGAWAQDKNSLDTKVVAEGGTITLSWDKKHPWDADMLARGVSLLAEYKTRSNGGSGGAAPESNANGP